MPFNIPAQPLKDALVTFGLQAGVSIGAGDLSRCATASRSVVGRYTAAQALGHLLSGTRCSFRAVDGRAYSVVPRVEPVRSERAPGAPPPEVVEDPTAVVLLDLTVTTTRRPSLVSRTPASVSVASSDQLRIGRISSLPEVAPEFAGVTVTNLGPGRNKVFVRGLSDGAFTGRTQSTVGLYLDDVPITYNAPDPDLRLVDVERLELMRGPQGTLYGVGSMGGIVRIVTKQPDLNASSWGMAAGTAFTQSGAPSWSLDLMGNAAIIPGRLGVRAVAYSEVAGGYVDDAALNIQDANRTTRSGVRAAVSGLISPDWQLTVGGTVQALRSADSQYAEGGLERLQRDTPVREPHENDFHQVYATLDGSMPWGRLRVSTAYLNHAFQTRYDATSGLQVFSSVPGLRVLDQADRVRLAVAEAVLSSQPGGRLDWLAGVFASRTLEDLDLNISALPPVRAPVPLYLEDRKDRLGEAAVYGELSYTIADGLRLTAGLRAFRAWLHTSSFRDQSGITRSFDGSLSTDDISPKVVLSWQASPSKLFYLQAAQGYRTGGFNTTGRITQQFNATATGNQPNRRYRPDTLWSYEAGAKMAFFDRRLELRTAVFYNDWRDVQSDQFLPSGLPYTANVGRGVNTGFEGEATVRASRALTLRLSFLANAPELRQRDPTYPARPNASLPAVPRYSASFIGEWRRPLSERVQAVLYGRLAYVGSSILTFQEQNASQMGNYVTARLAAGLESAGWRLTAYMDNPGNAEGDTFAFGDPFTQGRVRQFTPLRPRTIGINLSRGL